MSVVPPKPEQQSKHISFAGFRPTVDHSMSLSQGERVCARVCGGMSQLPHLKGTVLSSPFSLSLTERCFGPGGWSSADVRLAAVLSLTEACEKQSMQSGFNTTELGGMLFLEHFP